MAVSPSGLGAVKANIQTDLRTQKENIYYQIKLSRFKHMLQIDCNAIIKEKQANKRHIIAPTPQKRRKRKRGRRRTRGGEGGQVEEEDVAAADENEVCWLLNVPATRMCMPGTDLHRKVLVLPH